jgi:hypothetical protein
MRRSFWLLFVLAGLGAAALPHGTDSEELEHNRRLLEKWKADPDHHQRLKRDLAAFHALSPERQERIRAVDRHLHEGDSSTQGRLWGVLERYAGWLERLPESDRRLVLEAPTAEARLEVISGLKQRQWRDRLPGTMRAELLKLPEQRQVERMKELRLLEWRQRILWQRPFQGKNDPIPKPKQMTDFPPEVKAFIKEKLEPRLSAQEKQELKRANAAGKWPELPRLVAKLADRYPVLPPLPRRTITQFHELPPAMRNKLDWRHNRPDFKEKVPYHLQGKWPDFALGVTEVYRRQYRRQPPPLGASKPDEFPAEVRTFLREKLFTVLSPMEKERLRWLEGRWPDYPRRLLYLARRKQLVIPGMSLPGPHELWASADLALYERSEEARERLEFGPMPGFPGWLKKLQLPGKKGHRSGGRRGGR